MRLRLFWNEPFFLCPLGSSVYFFFHFKIIKLYQWLIVFKVKIQTVKSAAIHVFSRWNALNMLPFSTLSHIVICDVSNLLKSVIMRFVT